MFPEMNHISRVLSQKKIRITKDKTSRQKSSRLPNNMHQSRPRNKRKPESARSKSAPGAYNTGNMQAFDPGQNVHLWTMWRIAVTEQIIRNTKTQQRLREEGKQTKKPDTLTNLPLSQYIHVTASTHARANAMMGTFGNVSSSDLLTNQFIYYGLPRVNIRHDDSSAVSHQPLY